MKIVVLDGYTLNPGDLSWDGLRALGELTVYDRTAPEQVAKRATGAQVVLTNKTRLDAAVIAALPELKYIGVLATGYNVVDIRAAAARGIVVVNVPAYSTMSVVQMTFSLLFELCLHVKTHSDAVHAGEWTNSSDFCFWKLPLVELAGKTIGIVGFGHIGQKVADVAAAFGMHVIAHSRHHSDQSGRADFRWVAFEELMAQADVVTLHCPLFPETTGLINAGSLARMKPSAFLINTSRGGLICGQDLADALNTDRIAGAGLDVLSTEPPKADDPLLRAKNCLITPHIAWATKEARIRLMDVTVQNLKAFAAGKPVNVVNGL